MNKDENACTLPLSLAKKSTTRGIYSAAAASSVSFAMVSCIAVGTTTNTYSWPMQLPTPTSLGAALPPPFTRVPRPLVQGALGLVMRFVGGGILPRFASLLETDYGRWCNGTRDMTGLGSLTLDDEGYLVVPDEVLQKMKNQSSALGPSGSLPGGPVPPGF